MANNNIDFAQLSDTQLEELKKAESQLNSSMARENNAEGEIILLAYKKDS